MLRAMTGVADDLQMAILVEMRALAAEVREIRATLAEYEPAMKKARDMLDNPAWKWRRNRDRD